MTKAVISHKLNGLKSRDLLSHSSGGDKCKCQQGWFFLRALRENLLHAFPELLVTCWQSFAFLGFVITLSLLSSSCYVLSVCVCVFKFPFGYKDTSHIRLGAHSTPLWPHPASKQFWDTKGWDLSIWILERIQFNP